LARLEHPVLIYESVCYVFQRDSVIEDLIGMGFAFRNIKIPETNQE
jgi:hypothetical protein